MRYKTHSYNVALAITLSVFCLGLSGCPDQAVVVSSLESGLNDLVQNRALAEQFVRDIKAKVPPSDADYVQAMESYQDARSLYEHFLDTVEDDHNGSHSRSLRDLSPDDVQVATTAFLADAVRALYPSANARGIPLKQVVVIPDNLQPTLQRLPKKARDRIIEKFDRQVRWRSWSQL